MNHNRRTKESLKTIRNRWFNYVSIVTSILPNCSYEISKNYLAQKMFSKGFTDTNKRQKKKKKKNRQSMAIVNETSFHGNITWVLNITFLTN